MFDPQFTSIKVHSGYSHGRRDDIESLGYSILSMIKPKQFEIPWSRDNSLEPNEVLKLKCEFLGVKYPKSKEED